MSVSTEIFWISLPVPALLLTIDDRVADLNPAGEAFLNTSAKAVRGAPVWDRLFVDAPLEEAFQRVRQKLAPLFLNDVDVGSGDRAPVQCNMQVAPLADETGRVLILMEPREIADRLGRVMSMKSAARSAIGMAEMLAHEIKNPLAGISGAAQLLSMHRGREELELTDMIVAETRRIAKLLEQVEQFGNLAPPNRKSINLHDILDRVRMSATVGFAAHMDILAQYDPSLPPTFGDPDQLTQVFLNLLKNAAEANPAGGTIRIRSFYELSLRVRGPNGAGGPVPLQVEIVDDGPGLPPAIADEIFEPFVSGRRNGTGLGLALVGEIIAGHGGWVSHDSTPGRTVFRISLPVAPREKETF